MPENLRWQCRGCPICEALELAKAKVRYYDGSKAAGLPILQLEPNEQ